MSNNENNTAQLQPDINFQPDIDTSDSSVEVRLTQPRDPDTAPTESDTEGSVDSQVSRPKCIVKVKFGSVWEQQAITEVATIKVTQDDFFQCRVYTKGPVKQRQIEEKVGPPITRVWSSATGPLTFELEVREKKQPPQIFGPLTEARAKDHEKYLKRQREE